MKVLLFENQYSDVLISRLSYARFLKKNGFDIYICCDFDLELQNQCKKEGFHYYWLKKVRSMNPVNIFTSIIKIRSFLVKEKIDYVHCFRFQPIVIGAISSIALPVKPISHITGLGTYFSGKGLKNKVMAFFIKSIYKFNNRVLKVETVVQNPDDKNDLGFSCKVIKGSGTNENLFNNKVLVDKNVLQKFSDYDHIFLFASRLLKSKGVLNLVEAFKIYQKTTRLNVILIIAGEPDGTSPDSISEEDFKRISKEKNIYATGRIKNVNQYMAISSCSVFPSVYREGVPRFLIESLAMYKPVITTNTPGNKEVFNENGVLIEGNSIELILESFFEFEKMNMSFLKRKSKELYLKEFSQKVIYNQLKQLYSQQKNA